MSTPIFDAADEILPTKCEVPTPPFEDVKQINSELGSLESKVEENTSRIEEYSMIEEPDIEFIIADLENE